MLKKAISALLTTIVIFLLLPLNIFAAQQGNLNHKNSGEDGTDTADYCLSVYDVNLGLSELRDLSEGKIHELIAKTAAPKILVRDSAPVRDDWTQMPIDDLTFDFSEFRPEARDEGYTVKVATPKINLEKDSTIPFKVYVNDDFIYATIKFAETELPDLKLDITGDMVLNYAQLKAPTKEGHSFTGWYLDEANTKPFLLPDENDYTAREITGDLVLYPGWREVPASPQVQPETIIAPQSPDISKVKTSERPSPSPSEERTRKTEVKTPNEIGTSDKSMYTEKGSITMMEICVLLVSGVTVIALIGSIVSDIRVLNWYESKKKARMKV